MSSISVHMKNTLEFKMLFSAFTSREVDAQVSVSKFLIKVLLLVLVVLIVLFVVFVEVEVASINVIEV